LFLSVLTLGEIHQGIARLPPGARRDSLQRWVDEDLARRFHGRILPIDAEIAAEWGRLSGASRARGQPLPVVDGLLAATAITRHLTVVTRDVADISRCGAAVLDPWPPGD
jgi:predicted nucleic acid-binding protein